MSLIFYVSFYRFHGEKLQRNVNSGGGKRRRVADKQVIISTIYDNPSETDPPEPLMRSRGPHHLKYRVYRHEIEFCERGSEVTQTIPEIWMIGSSPSFL